MGRRKLKIRKEQMRDSVRERGIVEYMNQKYWFLWPESILAVLEPVEHVEIAIEARLFHEM